MRSCTSCVYVQGNTTAKKRKHTARSEGAGNADGLLLFIQEAEGEGVCACNVGGRQRNPSRQASPALLRRRRCAADSHPVHWLAHNTHETDQHSGRPPTKKLRTTQRLCSIVTAGVHVTSNKASTAGPKGQRQHRWSFSCHCLCCQLHTHKRSRVCGCIGHDATSK